MPSLLGWSDLNFPEVTIFVMKMRVHATGILLIHISEVIGRYLNFTK